MNLWPSRMIHIHPYPWYVYQQIFLDQFGNTDRFQQDLMDWLARQSLGAATCCPKQSKMRPCTCGCYNQKCYFMRYLWGYDGHWFIIVYHQSARLKKTTGLWCALIEQLNSPPKIFSGGEWRIFPSISFNDASLTSLPHISTQFPRAPNTYA